MEYKKYPITKDNITNCCVSTLVEVWSCIDWDKMDRRRIINFYDEFSSKVKAAAMTTNDFEMFVNKLAAKLGIRSYKSYIIDEIVSQDDKFHQEMLKKFRNPLLLILKLRLQNQIRKEMKEKLKEGECNV